MSFSTIKETNKKARRKSDCNELFFKHNWSSEYIQEPVRTEHQTLAYTFKQDVFTNIIHNF